MADTLEQFETTDGQTVKKVQAKDGRIMRFADGTPINAKQYAGKARHGVTSPITPVETEADDEPDMSAWTRETRAPNRFENVVEYSRPEDNISARAYPWAARAAEMEEIAPGDADLYAMGVWSIAIVGGQAKDERVVSRTPNMNFLETAANSFETSLAEQVIENASGYDDIVIVETFVVSLYE